MKAGNDTDVVFIPTRRQAAKPIMAQSDDEATDLKIYSTGTAAKVTFAKDKELLYSSIDPGGDPSNPERARKQNRKLLLTMRARDYTAEEASNSMQQEDLQEWLDNLQLKLHEARHSASSSLLTNPPERRSTVISIADQDDGQNK